MKISFHNHSVFSDGSDTMQDMLSCAYNEGFTHFAMTDHIHSDQTPQWTVTYDRYEEYLNEIKRFKDMYDGKMKIYTGIEADWYNGEGTYYGRYESLAGKLDITLGSVHNLLANGGNYIIDGSRSDFEECLYFGFYGNIKDMVACYYESYMEMAENFTQADLLCHIDLIRKNNAGNAYYDEDEKWVKDLEKALAKKMGMYDRVTEINGGGAYRKKNDVYYPSCRLIEYLKNENVRFTIGLDAHSTEMVKGYYDASISYAKKAGIDTLYVFNDGKWSEAESL
ncbi:MAG: histidinol-phosphatase HisJ family protein [Eubacteriaceae bacterium]|nr:histidinol-phosphatase HisJ family protein [Eubacteriaceae bacterium]